MRTTADIRFLAAVGLALLATACSKRDPATEESVQLKAGLYELKFTGDFYFKMPDGRRDGSKCIGRDRALDFARTPISVVAARGADCSETDLPSSGNAIRGVWQCRPSIGKSDGVTITYHGSHSTDNFDIRGMIDREAEPRSGPNYGSADFIIKGKRVGDC